MKKIIYSIAIIAFIAGLTGAIIAYGRGYRFNLTDKSIDSTGILSATSSPDGASIWIDGKLKYATNGSFSIQPGWYGLRIGKVGYQSWEKRIRVQGEVVTRVDALLIPNNPSLRALTVSGVLAPSLSPSSGRVAYIMPEDEATSSATLKSRIGVWVFDLRSGPLGGIADPKPVYQPLEKIDWYNSDILWSPDEKTIILTTKAAGDKSGKIISATQISLDNPNIPSLPVTSTLDSILADWDALKSQKQDQSLASLSLSLSDFLKNSANNIQFSPDNSKILYIATASATLAPIVTPPIIGTNPTEEVRTIESGKYYVYDIKEDKNFRLEDNKSLKDSPAPFWYTDSKRILIIENGTINIIDYDGTNKRTVYSGPFENNIVYPWTSPGKLVILTNLNKPKALPNLYEVDIR